MASYSRPVQFSTTNTPVRKQAAPLLFSLLSNQLFLLLLSSEFLFYEHLARTEEGEGKCVLGQRSGRAKIDDCSDKKKEGRWLGRTTDEDRKKGQKSECELCRRVKGH